MEVERSTPNPFYVPRKSDVAALDAPALQGDLASPAVVDSPAKKSKKDKKSKSADADASAVVEDADTSVIKKSKKDKEGKEKKKKRKSDAAA